MRTFCEFTQAYIECALWSTMDQSDETGGSPLEDNYDVEDIVPATLDRMAFDCAVFQHENSDDIASGLSHAGNDFWLTRNGHGVGFWDGEWSEPAATRLTDASKHFGEFNLYVDDNGSICS